MGREKLVLDPSVAAKWYLRDEPGRESANERLADLLNQELQFLVPELFYHELGNMLAKAAARHEPRISKIDARSVFLRVLDLPLDTVEVRQADLEMALDLALRHSKVYYDMVYVALAERLDCNWLTADEKVLKSSGPNFPLHRVEIL